MANISGSKTFLLRNDYDSTGGTTNTVEAYIYGLKLEKGAFASDWNANPADNATVTAVTSLSATVDGLGVTVSKKVDNDTFTSYQTQVANALVSKVESSDFTSYKTQTDSAIQAKVSSSDYNTEVTQLNNLINSKVTANGDITNIVLNPYFDNASANGWTGLAGVSTGNTFPGTKYYGGQTGRDAFYGGTFTVVPGDTYYFKVTAWTDNSTYTWSMGFRLVKSDGSITWNAPIMFASSDKTTKTAKFVIPSGIVQATVWTQINATSNFGEWWFTNIYVGKTVPATEMYSQISQLTDNINLRVQKNDVINQINVSSEGILIDGAKVHITGTTTIDNAVIKDAMIANLSASKLTAGTIDASLINVINLNANNISTGTITGVTFHQTSSLGNEAWIQNGTMQVKGVAGNRVIVGSSLANMAMISSDNHTLEFSLVDVGIGYYTSYGSTSNTGSGTKLASLSFADDTTKLPTLLTSLYGITLTDNTNSNSITLNSSGITIGSGSSLHTDFVGAKAMFYEPVIVANNFSVTGTKNAIVQTSQGWAKINAYETAEYYFGDMAKVNTGSGSKVKVMMDSLFLETVNTNVDYHVFVSSYGNGYAWVSEQGKDYFIIESNVPNLEVSYEVKAKRLGYENTRLEIDEDFGKEVA
ncbi:prophage protein [Liquorilactobacillus mali KCTC 3596 = DSM 20444]|uniref:Gp58-like domain-containing protein n=1 Tax=Liquorilactobacillus mali KCTC 3596 = DSM 20444 TaxID=1046596 RepID=J0UU47_9LACO|nr:gp58-like family protein [Liquorilactobacillus mali]EJF01099.1 prophage protein [Liquorilactobacillus mali KCTC 3596 = DSM 20444]KRN07321.1 hypothetical protein FD00_GL000209 [Liquorilactobacillus mali KCTC 3596 = DSM 20444]